MKPAQAVHDPYPLALMRQSLRPMRLRFCPVVGSTSDRAARLRRERRLFAPAVVLAGRQTAGRGRGSHRWWAGPGSLAATFVLPLFDHLPAHQLPLAAGVAIRSALADFCPGASLQLKWPNDVLSDGLKLAGLLCERLEGADFVGVGVNVNVDPARAPRRIGVGDVRGRITSLWALSGQAVPRYRVLLAIAHALEAMAARMHDYGFAQVLKEYEAHHALSGRPVAVRTGEGQVIHGLCRGLDRLGRLIIQDGAQRHTIIAGHVL